MTIQDGIKWYKPTEYADMYGKSRQSVNGLITRGHLQTRTIHGKTHVSGTPPYGWKPVSRQETMARKLQHMHPYDFQDEYWDEQEPPPPKQEPFRGAWKLARIYDLSWRVVEWTGKKLKNDPDKVALFFRIMDDKDKAFWDAQDHNKVQMNPPEILFDYMFQNRLIRTLNGQRRKPAETD